MSCYNRLLEIDYLVFKFGFSNKDWYFLINLQLGICY